MSRVIITITFLIKEQMKFRNIVLAAFVVVLGISSANAQLNILNSTTPEDIGVKTLDQLA